MPEVGLDDHGDEVWTREVGVDDAGVCRFGLCVSQPLEGELVRAEVPDLAQLRLPRTAILVREVLHLGPRPPAVPQLVCVGPLRRLPAGPLPRLGGATGRQERHMDPG